jgi:hypothetical protein
LEVFLSTETSYLEERCDSNLAIVQLFEQQALTQLVDFLLGQLQDSSREERGMGTTLPHHVQADVFR